MRTAMQEHLCFFIANAKFEQLNLDILYLVYTITKGQNTWKHIVIDLVGDMGDGTTTIWHLSYIPQQI